MVTMANFVTGPFLYLFGATVYDHLKDSERNNLGPLMHSKHERNKGKFSRECLGESLVTNN